MKKSLLLKLLLTACLPSILYLSYNFTRQKNVETTSTIILDTFYGKHEITEPVLIDIINHVGMQRLKDIRQYGLDYYVYKQEEYSRYDHSLGVFLLAKRFGASLKEQIASLIHDISHTAFSHLGDYVFKQIEKNDSYQDSIHKKFIISIGLDTVLNKYGIDVDEVLNKNDEFKILEQASPDICADRLEYNLFGGYLENKLSIADVNQILNDLRFDDEKWYFVNIESAKKFALVTLFLTETKWAFKETLVRNILGSKLILRAIEIELITEADFHFGKDDKIWNLLINSDDEYIKNKIKQLKHIKKTFIIDNNDYDIFIKPKMRGLNPWVKTEDGLNRLTEVDLEYKKAYDRLKDILNEGVYIKLLTD